MASITTVELLDDIDGKPAAETVSFGLDGREFEIDLSEKNAKALRKALEPFAASARRVGGRRARPSGGAPARGGSGVDTKAVRAWAIENGIEISARGRIASEVLQQYQEATG